MEQGKRIDFVQHLLTFLVIGDWSVWVSHQVFNVKNGRPFIRLHYVNFKWHCTNLIGLKPSDKQTFTYGRYWTPMKVVQLQ